MAMDDDIERMTVERASSTQRAISRTPSPCLLTCAAIGLSSASGVVSTRRTLSCCRTYDARSRMPVSGPAYATSEKPNADR